MNLYAPASIAIAIISSAADANTKTTERRTYHVSVAGDDGATGTQERPFQTIQRAAEPARPGDTCVIHGGRYRENVVLKASGTSGQPIRFTSAEGEVVAIDGTDPIAGDWRARADGVWELNLVRPVEQLFLDDQPLSEARWPSMPFQDNWVTSKKWAEFDEGSRARKLVSNAEAESGIDFTGAIVCLKVAGNYAETRRVTSHAPGQAEMFYESLEAAKEEQASVVNPCSWHHCQQLGESGWH